MFVSATISEAEHLVKSEMQMQNSVGGFSGRAGGSGVRVPFEEQRVLNGTAAAEDGDKTVSQHLQVSHHTTPHISLLVTTGQFHAIESVLWRPQYEGDHL